MKILLPLTLLIASMLAHATPPPPPPAPNGEGKLNYQIHAHVVTYLGNGKYGGMVALRCDKPPVEIKYPIYINYSSYPQVNDVICEATIDDKKIKISMGLTLNDLGAKKSLGILAHFQSEDANEQRSNPRMSKENLTLNLNDVKGMSLSFNLPHEMSSKATGNSYTIDGSVYVELVD
jgi:hypothetical protein